MCKQNKFALIEAVKKYPILFKKRCKKIPDQEKDNCWLAISENLGIPQAQCKYDWRRLRYAYIRSKNFGHSFTRYDKALSFLDQEIEDEIGVLEILEDSDQEVEQAQKAEDHSIDIVSTSQSKRTNDIVNLLSSDDDESRDSNEKVTNQLISSGPREHFILNKQLPSGCSIESQPCSSSSVPTVSFQEGDFPFFGTHSAKSIQKPESLISQEPRMHVFGLHSINENNADQYPKTIKRTKDPEIVDIDNINYLNNAKRFKPSSSNNIQEETSTVNNLSIKDIVNKQDAVPNTELPSVSTEETVKDNKTFFKELSSLIKSKFSLKKQKDLQSQIYSLLTSEELKRMQTH